VICLINTKTNQAPIKNSKPTIAQVIVCPAEAVALGSPAEVRYLKPPIKIMIKIATPAKGIKTPMTLEKITSMSENFAGSSPLGSDQVLAAKTSLGINNQDIRTKLDNFLDIYYEI